MRKDITLGLVLALLATPTLAATAFKLTLLDSDHSTRAMHIDPNLVNPWGECQGPGTDPIWVSDNHTGLSTVYAQGTGVIESIVVTIPQGSPTGCVFNSTSGFKITEGSKSGAAVFIFASEAGIISGWNGSVDAANAVVAYDGSANGSVYKGLAIDTSSNLLFAADFVNNKVQVFDSSFKLVKSFTDKSLRGYSPFNIMVLNGDLYVTFAKRARTCCDEKHGPGLGAVDVFDESGNLLQTLVPPGGELNAPWGLAVAPSSGIIGPEGLNLTVSADPSDLPNGTWTGTIIVAYGSTSVTNRAKSHASSARRPAGTGSPETSSRGAGSPGPPRP